MIEITFSQVHTIQLCGIVPKNGHTIAECNLFDSLNTITNCWLKCQLKMNYILLNEDRND